MILCRIHVKIRLLKVPRLHPLQKAGIIYQKLRQKTYLQSPRSSYQEPNQTWPLLKALPAMLASLIWDEGILKS